MGLGYMSEAKVCGNQVLGTGSSISPQFQRLESSGVRGAGYLNSGLSVFAWHYAQWEGSIDWDASTKDGAFQAVGRWAVTNRDEENTLEAKPGGNYTMSIKGHNSGFSGNTSAGSLVSLSASCLCIGDKGSVSGSGGGSPADIAGNSIWCGDDSLVAYWQTSASISNGGGSCALDWNFQITNSVIPLLCCSNGSGKYYNPTETFLGPTEATISMTFYEGSIPNTFWDRNVTATIQVGSLGSVSVTGVIEGVDAAIQTGDAIVGCGVTVKSVACDKPAVSIG